MLVLTIILSMFTITSTGFAVKIITEKDIPGTESDGSGVTQSAPNETEDSRTNTKIVGYITYTFAEEGPEYPQRSVTASVVENKPLSDDEWIESWLKNLYRAGQQGTILHIDAINGVPIEKTKWAEYGGEIPVTNPYPGGRNPLGMPIKDPDGNVRYNGFYVKTDKYIGNDEFLRRYYEAGYGHDDPILNKAYGNNSENPLADDKPKMVTVIVNHEPVYFPDAKPFIVPDVGRTMVPMRAVFEHFWVQSTVLWDEKSRTVTATNRQGRKIIFTIDQKEMTIIEPKGKVIKVENDVAPMIQDGRTYLPLRAMAEALTLKVEWIDDTYVVDITGDDYYNKFLMTRKDWGAYLVDFNKKNPY